MAGSKSEARSGNWEGTVLLLSGGSHMGKSFFAKTVLASEYNAVYRQIDNVYTAAVNDARMVAQATPRRWPTRKGEMPNETPAGAHAIAIGRATTVKADFFASYKKQIDRHAARHSPRRRRWFLEGGHCATRRIEIARGRARDLRRQKPGDPHHGRGAVRPLAAKPRQTACSGRASRPRS